MLYVFLFNDTATTEIYTLSLHDALPILAQPEPAHVAPGAAAHRPRRRAAVPPQLGPGRRHGGAAVRRGRPRAVRPGDLPARGDRKSTRLNSSHANISYAVFCLKKKKTTQ